MHLPIGFWEMAEQAEIRKTNGTAGEPLSAKNKALLAGASMVQASCYTPPYGLYHHGSSPVCH